MVNKTLEPRMLQFFGHATARAFSKSRTFTLRTSAIDDDGTVFTVDQLS